MTFIKKIISRLSQPPGVLSWARILGHNQEESRHHWKAMWTVYPQQSVSVYRGVYLLQLLSWYSVFAWINLAKGIRYIVKKSRREGKRIAFKEIVKLIYLLFAYTIPLPSIVRYRLLENPCREVLAHIYPHEIPKWQYMLCKETISDHEKKMLSDKSYFADICIKNNIPCIETILDIPQSSDESVIEKILTVGQSFFLKPPNANRSRACYLLEFANGSHQLNLLGEEKVFSQRSLIIEELKRANKTFNLIVQPLLKNIPSWQDLSKSNELITMRLITELYGDRCQLIAAVLELPKENRGKFYNIIPIHPKTGLVHDQLFGYNGKELEERQVRLLSRIGSTEVPHWDEVVENLQKAHAQCPHIKTVGWDMAVTPKGPVIIEGNFGWGVHTLTRNPLALKKLIDIEI